MKDANYPPNYKLSDLSDKSLINYFMEKPHTYLRKKYKDFSGDVIEFGCGDGNNIKYFNFYSTYTFTDYHFKLFNEENIQNKK